MKTPSHASISLAKEVAESLKQGDHLRHSRQFLRSFVTVSMLIFLMLRPAGGGQEMAQARLTLILANPVAHGSRLAAAVMDALQSMEANLAGDRRLAAGEIAEEMVHFPSLTVLSFGRSVTRAHLAGALELRRYAVLAASDYPGLSRVYLEILFLLQAIRYDLAQTWVASLPQDHIWLCDFDRPAYSRPVIWQARMLGRATATLVHGAPSHNYLPPVAQNVLVWGEAQLDWFRAASPETTCHVIGRPEIGRCVEPGTPQRLRVMHSMESLMPAETAAVLRLCSVATSWGLIGSLRLHPSLGSDGLDEDWKAIAEQLVLEDNTEDFLGSLTAGDVVVGINSTAIIDALTVGLPAWTLADTGRELPCDLSRLRGASGALATMLSVPSSKALLTSAGPDMFRHLSPPDLRATLVAATGAEAAELLRRALSDLVRS